jgi:hypothetical protein
MTTPLQTVWAMSTLSSGRRASPMSPCGLQYVELLVESFGSTSHAGFPDLGQPLDSMPRVIDVRSRTRNRPAAVHRFQPIHDQRQIFDDGQITSGQFPPHAHARLAVVDRLELVAAQRLRELASIDPITFVSIFE